MCLSAAGLLAGCGAKNRHYYSCSRYHRSCFYRNQGRGKKGDPVVINYYDWDIPDQKFIDDFNAANPDIQVVAHSIPC